MSQINEFNRACKLIFEALYESFPVPIDIGDSDIGFIDKNDISNEPREILSATFNFLCDEGYIVFNRASDHSAQKRSVRLTSKGLIRLQRVPDGIQQEKKPLIDQLKEAGSSIGGSVSATAMAEATKQVLSLVFGGSLA